MTVKTTDAANGPSLDEDKARAQIPVLLDALHALGSASEADRANRLAGRALAVLRHSHPTESLRVNELMHRLARVPAKATDTKERRDVDPRLDVRNEPPARRHQLIFDAYDGLRPDTGFELLNDHDPRRLYQQFEAEHEGSFTWEYLEQGPEVWRIRVGRPA